ncbi:5-(carboxyamino)imidazole ribonucleotide synthase [Rhodothalassium salexigens]|uniref:5-(carboxyamino)imidazole ribonucleotide synthase n=1 Tax=Rhodothalassium salexigens TaxID=1086 RepID=UPI001912C928|nr:5-(carboxyamino)imidazole ribonucleotide synthase [Rhodothalassium salexigens]MBK5911731.1 5-(carboxyamino)imidazole ribonucleotide synthase [Rhodothalassium salexigens]MBK5920481.1 5-(carboxyamino)imidazole ribonucleotide synthase [Rhodothalassium salexigens]
MTERRAPAPAVGTPGDVQTTTPDPGDPETSTAPRLQPGDTVGILGGGQLGRMLAMAAAQLGLRSHVYCPDPDSPAFQVASHATCADYDDQRALALFADQVAVATYEFENIPAEAIAYLSTRSHLAPSEMALMTANDRLVEKEFLNAIGVATAPYRAAETRRELAEAADAVGYPCIAKTRRFGYDGKGQARLDGPGDLDAVWDALGPAQLIVEGVVAFDKEISVVTARTADGRSATFPVSENSHENHILARSVAPARIPDAAARTAADHAQRIAAALDYVGALAVEYFLTPDGGVLANEIAPRVHNSFHWTIEGAVTSQFAQHIRAIAGWPLGATDLVGAVEMQNLLGDAALDWLGVLADPTAHLHLYGKGTPRPGRKMGHVTWVRPHAGP